MEHRKNNSHGTKNGMKSESLGTQRVYDVHTSRSRGTKNGGVKRKLDSEGLNEVRKKSKKDVLLKSLLSERKNKKSVGQVGKARISLSSPDSGEGEFGLDKKRSGGGGDGDGGLSGISLKLDGDVYIPKRPRDLVRRKKFDVALASNQEGVLGSIASLGNGKGNENEKTDRGLIHNGNINGKLPWNGVSEGDFGDEVIGNVKKENQSDDHREFSLSGCDLVEHLKRENSQSCIHIENSDSLIKNAKRLRKKVKETRLAAISMSRGIEQFSNEPSTVLDETQDDEENLEANAARMLSSRFDPSCTMFPSGGKIYREPFANELSPSVSSNYKFDITHPTSLAESNMSSSDGEARAVGDMDQQKGNSLSRKRRHFYEVLSKDFDSYWVLNRRIKVFWPLDESWYIGHVTGYNPEKKLHHIKYDDRDEEWVDLENEKFKLFLLPSEVPGKVGRKRPTIQDRHSRKGKREVTAYNNQQSNSYIESEPIISWLGSSSLQRSQPFGVRKKQRTRESAKSSLSLDCEGKSKLMEIPEVNVSGPDLDNLVCGSAVSNNSRASVADIKLLEHKVLSKNSSSPIVYFRRRFQKRGHQSSDMNVPDLIQFPKEASVFETAADFVDSPDFGLDMLQSMVECGCRHKNLGSNELIWDIDCSGRLKLFIPITSLKVLKGELSFPVSVGDNLFGGHNFMLMQQHGTLISVSRMVCLKILFVDNTVGLRFLLFEGCLMQAVSFVFLVLVVFQSSHRESFVGQQLPVTSIRFQFTGLRTLAKQLVFTFYYFTKVANSKWSYLDRKLSKHCVATKQLPPPECTYGNILALQNGRQLPLISAPHNHLSAMSIQKIPRPQGLSNPPKQSSIVKQNHITSDSDEKLPPFALSFAAPPKFFISLHLKLLMERSISSSSIGEQDLIVDCSEDYEGIADVDRLVGKDNSLSCTVSMGFSSGSLLSSKLSLESCVFPDLGDNLLSGDIDGVTAKPSCSSFDLPENGEIAQMDNMTAGITHSENCVMSEERISADNPRSSVNPDTGCGPKANLLSELPSFISSGSVADTVLENVQHPIDSAVVSNDGGVCARGDTSRILFHNCRNGNLSPTTSACLSSGWSDRKPKFIPNGFGNGPRKPRTQVSYSMLLSGNVHSYKNNLHHGKGFSHKRIRRASTKKTSDAFGSSKRSTGLLSCDGNCLITAGDRGWRECGARVVLELVDHNEWRLVVRISGDTKYSHKPHQFLQPGTTNRYTHAMMWKGGKDWILEFTDRSQWATFKEMHEECFNRNLRAASVKNIPIPGVRLIEENIDSVLEVPFMRPSSKYHRQLDTDVDIAMNPSRVLYDMDSDDEQWLQKCRGLDFSDLGCDVSDEMFEKTMDAFEKFAYAKQCDHFSLEELEDAMAGLGPFNTVLNIYEHWREKRQKKGMPLIRHLQPPLWEKYQQQVKECEQIVSFPYSGCSDKSSAGDKPAMFAFCLKPRGLEAVPSRGSKHRSQKKLPTGFLSNGVLGCPEYFHSPAGRNLNGCSPGDDRLIYSAYNEGASDYSPILQQSMSLFSPRDGGVSMGHFSLNNDGFERNYYSKPYKIKSKKLCFIPQSNDPSSSSNLRTMGKGITGNMWNMGFSSEWASQINSQPEGFQRHNYDQVGPSELDEFRLRDAASAARHAVTVAKLKRENSQRMLCRADLAMQKAIAAIMTAEAVKASYVDANNDVQLTW